MMEFLNPFKAEVEKRLQGFYAGIQTLKAEGFAVDAITPMAAIYLTVQFNLKGLNLPDGTRIETTEQITSYLLSEAKLALVPFNAFGASKTSTWYRLSVGTASMDDVKASIESLRIALSKLSAS
jgi:aspartate aminotransferase